MSDIPTCNCYDKVTRDSKSCKCAIKIPTLEWKVFSEQKKRVNQLSRIYYKTTNVNKRWTDRKKNSRQSRDKLQEQLNDENFISAEIDEVNDCDQYVEDELENYKLREDHPIKNNYKFLATTSDWYRVSNRATGKHHD